MKRRYLLILPVIFCGFYAKAQEKGLFIQSGAQVYITSDGALNAQSEIHNQGIIEIDEDARLISHENLVNDGVVANLGELALYKDLSNSPLSTFNSNTGKLLFRGTSDQLIQNTSLSIEKLAINKSAGRVVFTGDSVRVTGNLKFEHGVLATGGTTKLIVGRGAKIEHLFNIDSYFDGELISEGTGYREFPVGDGGYFGKIRFEEIRGGSANNRFGVSLVHAPESNPRPSDEIIGVSGKNVWQIRLLNGDVDSILVGIDYIDEDLENFVFKNDIRRRTDSPVLAVSDSSMAGPYQSLGLELLTDTDPDSVQSGNLLAGEYANFENALTNYFAIALAPLKDDKGQIYFPNVFAPRAMDRDNQFYKVFGEFVAESPFQMEIYNRFSQLVYSTDSFEEATTIGWDGTNRYGNEEYTGLYYVYVRYAFISDPTDIKEFKGPIMLKR